MGTQSEKFRSSERPDRIGFGTAEQWADPGWTWAPYEPDAARPWSLALAAHLYRRATFGASWGQLQQALADGPQRTVDKLLRPPADVGAFNRRCDESEDTAAGSVEGLRAWWLRRMMETPHPLLEKMTLFWHSYFAVNAGPVNNARLMKDNVRLLRRHALGSFGSLLPAVARDPAMLIWLGADVNRKATPNDRFVRPLLETFTLGPGHFTEEDVRAAARAFTGRLVLRGQLRDLPQEHDETTKRFLGREGNFAAEDVMRILLEEPATARTLVRRLYRWLISETEEPNGAQIAPLAESFAKDYNVEKLVETMLRSNLFFSGQAYRQRVKGPLEFSLGLVKALEGMVSATQLAQDVANLGQDLCHPPTVKGWTGGLYWISTATLVGRHNLAAALLEQGKFYGGKLDPWAVAHKYGYTTPEAAGRFLLDLLVQADLEPGVCEALLQNMSTPATDGTDGSGATLRHLVYAVATLPEYQLA
jgi:uncharacterized protein (DUF1800 family)